MSTLKKTYKIRIEWITTGRLWWKKTIKYYCIYEVTFIPVHHALPYEYSDYGIIDYHQPSYKESLKMIEKHTCEVHAQHSLEEWLKYNSE